MLAWVKNTTGANVEFEWKDPLDNSHSSNTMNFKEIWNYEAILNIKKDKFYDVQLKINLNVVKGVEEANDKYKEYEYITNISLSPEAKLVEYINAYKGSTFITVDELTKILKEI